MSEPIVTAFVATCGESPTLAACLEALQRQDVECPVQIVRDVAPMSRAFQVMADRCGTEFYVQVDDDMVPYPGAIRLLLEDIQKQPANVYMFVRPLWDEHLRMAIQGVKIYRAEVMRKARYSEESSSCEMAQANEAKRLGYSYAAADLRRDLCVGFHGTQFTPEAAFDRYFRLAQKQQRFGWCRWSYKLPMDFLRRFAPGVPLESPDLWAFIGSIIGRIMPLPELESEKDFRESPCGFAEVRALLAEKPVGLNVYQTSKCTLNCKWCARTKRILESAPDMTPALLNRVLDKWPFVAACFAGFGEPLLSDTLIDCMKLAISRGLYVRVVTSGILLEGKAAELKAIGCSGVDVSLNAGSAKEYEESTGNDPACFDKAVAGIKAALACGLDVQVTRVTTQQNMEAAGDFLSLAAEMGASHIALHNLLPHGVESVYDPAYWASVLHKDMSGLDEWFARMREHPEAHRVAYWPVPISRGHCPRKCTSPFTNIGVDGWGHVSPCRRVSAPAHFKVALDDYDAWMSDAFVKMREGMAGAGTLRAECQLCFGNWGG